MLPRHIKAGSAVHIWLNEYPQPTLQEPDSVLERIVKASPSTHLYTARAAIRDTGGHESDLRLGATFTSSQTTELIIRVPVGGKVDDYYEGLPENWARMIFADLILASYSELNSLVNLNAGLLDLSFVAVNIGYSRGYRKYPYLALQILPLLWFGTNDLSDENVLRRMNSGGKLDFSETDTAVVSHLLPALNDPEVNVRSRAANLLGDIKSNLAVPELINAARRDALTTSGVVSALAAIGDRQAVEPLITLLRKGQRSFSQKT